LHKAKAGTTVKKVGAGLLNWLLQDWLPLSALAAPKNAAAAFSSTKSSAR
jgi:hypothetical protein